MTTPHASGSSARPGESRPPRPTARAPGLSRHCGKRSDRRPTACPRSRPRRSGRCSTGPASATSRAAPGAPPGPRSASGRAGWCWSPTPTPSRKKLIEDAYLTGEAMGLAVWCTDQAGPFQTVPHPGPSWRPEGQPARQPHEYLRDGTAKLLTLFHPADGRVRVEGVTACPNRVLHGWLKRELTAVLAATPVAVKVASRSDWERWQRGLSIMPTLLDELPPLR